MFHSLSSSATLITDGAEVGVFSDRQAGVIVSGGAIGGVIGGAFSGVPCDALGCVPCGVFTEASVIICTSDSSGGAAVIWAKDYIHR